MASCRFLSRSLFRLVLIRIRNGHFFLRGGKKMKKGIADIVQRLSGWGDEPDYELLEISDNGDNFSFVVKKDNLESVDKGENEENEESV
jgi:hypothetical protein